MLQFIRQKIPTIALIGVLFIFIAAQAASEAQDRASAEVSESATAIGELSFPPVLPDGSDLATDATDEFLKFDGALKDDVAIAATAPTVDFLYYPQQTYPGNPWSNWGDSLTANGKYYASIGDHLAPAGNTFVFEFDPKSKTMRRLADVRAILNLPEGHYAPGKIHGRLDLGSDGWLYYSTHRGSTKVTTDQYHYEGDWILRSHPETGESQVVVHAPVPKHCIPNSVLDPERGIFYGGTAAGVGADIQFFAYDVNQKKLLYAGPDGPARSMIFAPSTGRIYYTPGQSDRPLMRYDPRTRAAPTQIEGVIGIRAATQETGDGYVYTVSTGQEGESVLYAFNTRTEEIEMLGPAAVASQQYVASIDVSPDGRYLYYVPGAHGGSDSDGSAVVQFDTRTNAKKVIAFLHPFYVRKYGAILRGTYSTAVDETGETLYVTWNVSRGGRAWDCCALTAIHIPASERP